MQIKIGKKDINLNFGVRFVRELDKLKGMEVEVQGIKQKFGMGLTVVLPSLRQFDPATLSDVLYCASWDNKSRPTQKAIDDFIDNDADLDKLFDEVLDELQKANAVKGTIARMSKNKKA
ncbi:tail assembly chaperone [Limosilactobacillus urinaemulieris]|uniref:tail assembly chaperone n=1 Tax=Limosilactobacillus urinaemulieris TaxID=2742600 RepID=UPI0028EE21F8|nr:tail assembly chaperone [Limosilactobacillus urinaemulieris]